MSPAATLREQWAGPSDIFSILLILGGDVIQLALASLSSRPFTPLSFSFGWVAYAISAILGAVSENRLILCAPEISCLAINVQSGYARNNNSWLLARFLKTYPFWMPEEVKLKAEDYRMYTSSTDPEAHRSALCVAIYEWSPDPALGGGGIPVRDRLWWSGIIVTVVQLGIAAVPFGLEKDWSIFLVTAAGSMLAYASGSLPQWTQEKYHANRQKHDKKNVAITRGNGARHVIIVKGKEGALDLEDLAAGWEPDSPYTQVATLALALLWFVLLITSTGIKENTWYLLAVGSIGMLHNLMVGAWPRKPASLGLPLQLAKITGEDLDGQKVEIPAVIGEPKVMWTLMELEERYKNYGRSLVEEFFPGKMSDWEKEWWDSKDSGQRANLLREGKKQFYMKKLQESTAKTPVQVVVA